jgi:hypothetical protein
MADCECRWQEPRGRLDLRANSHNLKKPFYFVILLYARSIAEHFFSRLLPELLLFDLT